VAYSGRYTPGGAEEDYVFVAWVGCDEDSYKRSRFWWDTEGGYGYASTSNHHGQARMEWNSGREASVWERTMVTLVGATPIKCVIFLCLS